MTSSLILPVPPEVVRLTEPGRQAWNLTFAHKCHPTDLLTVEDVHTQDGVDCGYLVRMISRTDELWLPPNRVIRMRWLGLNNWEEVHE